VRLVLRSIAFLTGLFLITVFGVVVNDMFPWTWLPMLMGATVWLVVSAQEWMKAHRLGALLSGVVTLGTTFFYCLSCRPVQARLPLMAPHVALTGIGIAFVFVLVPFLLRGFGSQASRPIAAWFLIPITAVCVLGYVSGGIGGANHMIDWLISTLGMGKDQAETIIHILRKTIHFTAYGTVGYCLFRSGIAGRAPKRTSVIFALLIVFCIASFDELRQTTAPNRTGSVWDVALDMTGATTFVLVGGLAVPGTPRKRRLVKAGTL